MLMYVGPLSTHAKNGSLYFITFSDNLSRFRHMFLLKHKSEPFEIFTEYKLEVENQNTGISIMSFDVIKEENT